MDLATAIDRVLLGESLADIAQAYRAELLESFGMDPDETDPQTFRKESRVFVSKLCRELGDRRRGDSRAAIALSRWASRVEDYDAYDALLSNFTHFDGRARLLERGRKLFPGPLTAHWDG
ncbi:MAG: hypothetical protein U1F36_19170 [Planctomycetota bacterium]